MYSYDKIIQKYPYLYKEVKHIECDIGWYKLIDRLSKDLEKLIIELKENDYEEDQYEFLPCASQIKEKYGSLRFYMSSGTDKMDKLIEKAEQESCEICKICGKIGRIDDSGWLSCLCEKCRKQNV